jgi:hypothetical protein
MLCAAVLGLAACSSGSGSGKHAAPSTTASTAPRSTTVPAGGVKALRASVATTAYVWGSPLVITERTLQTFARLFGVNHLFTQGALATPASRLVVSPNVDTLYSIAVLDLRDGPVVLRVPSISDKYWTYQFLDAWTNSFAYVGTRTTGGRSGTWLITPPGWHGTTPSGMARISAPTPQAFMLGRWFVDEGTDIAQLASRLRGITLTPLSPHQATPRLARAPGTAQTVASDGAKFFDELGDALAIDPPVTAVDRKSLARFERFGIGPGLHPTVGATAASLDTMNAGVAAAAHQIDVAHGTTTTALAKNGWVTPLDVGVYTKQLVRAVTAQYGWGANVGAEAVYAQSTSDARHHSYTGATEYRMHFAAGQSPPVQAFWSLTLYSTNRFLVENTLHRYAISTRTPGFHVNADGSFDIWIGHVPPASGTANWLPAPTGPFELTLRMYLPAHQVLAGDYTIPPVRP